MNQWDFSFELSAWEAVIENMPSGSSFSASRFLTLMESETEDALEEALELLTQRDILLDIADLPASYGTGDTALRLRREEQLVKENKLPDGLNENDPLRPYLEELAITPVFGDPELLAGEYLDGKEDVLPALTNLMLGSVFQIAYEHTGRSVLLMDLIQEGSLGLWQAILDYRGGEFVPWCIRRIRLVMAKAVVLQARAGGIGQKLRQALEDYRAVDERLLTELGRNPTLEEIALELHMTAEEAAAVAETMEAARMMDRAKESAEEKPEEEDTQAVEDTAYFQMRQRIQELLSSLTEADAKLLTLRFGLEGGMPLSPEDTGKRLGLTPEEVVEKEAAALALLRSNG